MSSLTLKKQCILKRVVGDRMGVYCHCCPFLKPCAGAVLVRSCQLCAAGAWKWLLYSLSPLQVGSLLGPRGWGQLHTSAAAPQCQKTHRRRLETKGIINAVLQFSNDGHSRAATVNGNRLRASARAHVVQGILSFTKCMFSGSRKCHFGFWAVHGKYCFGEHLALITWIRIYYCKGKGQYELDISVCSDPWIYIMEQEL